MTKYILLCKDLVNPLGVVRSLGEEGIFTDVFAVYGGVNLLGHSRYIGSIKYVDTIEEGLNLILSRYGKDEKDKDFLISCDDDVTDLLDRRQDELRAGFYFFGSEKRGNVSKYIDKYNINQLAVKHGFNVLENTLVDNGTVPDGLTYPVLTKSESPMMGGWKKDVFKCEDQAELEAAFKQIKAPKVLIQRYLLKENEYCLDGLRYNGKTVITMACQYLAWNPTSYSNYMTVKNFDRPDLLEKIDSLLAQIGYEGVFCIEFLVDRDGELYFCEVNFRNSGWSYASTCAGMNLPYLWVRSIREGGIPTDAIKPIPEGFTAMSEVEDLRARVKTREVGLFKWLGEFASSNCKFYVGKHDFGPVLGFAQGVLKRKFGRG